MAQAWRWGFRSQEGGEAWGWGCRGGAWWVPCAQEPSVGSASAQTPEMQRLSQCCRCDPSLPNFPLMLYFNSKVLIIKTCVKLPIGPSARSLPPPNTQSLESRPG